MLLDYVKVFFVGGIICLIAQIMMDYFKVHTPYVMVTYVNQLKEAKNNKQFEEVVSMPDYLDNLYENLISNFLRKKLELKARY